MSTSTTSQRGVLRNLDHNERQLASHEVNHHKKKNTLFRESQTISPLPIPLPSSSTSPSVSPSLSQVQNPEPAVNVDEKGTAERELPFESIIAAPFCNDSDPFTRAFKIARYLHTSAFHAAPICKQYRRIDGAFTSPALNQACRPIYVDEANNACILFSAHRVNKDRQIHPSTGKLLMFKSEIHTALTAARAVWLDPGMAKKDGGDCVNLWMCHFSVTLNDIWVLKYVFTLDLYSEVQGIRKCTVECDAAAFRKTCQRWVAPVDWVDDCILDEEEQIKEWRSRERGGGLDNRGTR